MSEKLLRQGQRVKVVAKEVKGAIAYVGYPTFATGKWIGIVLDEPKGKNNGTVRGHAYFTCDENYGMFVRQTQIQFLDDADNPMETSMTSSVEETPKTSRTRLSSSRTSLAGSRQSLSGISYNSPSVERDGTPDATNKRAAFIETGFVETLNPQFTLGQSLTSPMVTNITSHGLAPLISSATEERLANLQNVQEIEKLKNQVEDLTEKLETIRSRRAEDREKLRELERVKLQLEQANEFKAKIMESQAQLQRDLQRAKQETREAREALEAHNDETAELSEACEMAALDKEMAEERAETLTMELEALRERLEEATLDLQLAKAEMEAAGATVHPYAAVAGPGAPPSGGFETRQLQQQNARLRDTLVRLRDLSAHDKHEMQKMQKDLDQKRSEIAELSRTKEKLSVRVDELEAQVADLQEQVDAALGAEEMVEQLAEKKMSLEDYVEQLKLDVSELEALQEVHEQLVESNRELEMDLREELEMAHSATREAVREREAALENLLDREATIQKFRELVQKLTDQAAELRTQLNVKDGDENKKEAPPSIVAVSSTETPSWTSRTHATRAVDLQLRALELAQARARADALAACLPGHFLEPAGDHDAVLLTLLLQRLSVKSDIIIGQLRERFPAVTSFDRNSVTKTHNATQYSFRCLMQYQLHTLQGVVNQFRHSLERCSPELLLRAASSLPDMSTQERSLDAILELLRAGSLDENCSTEGVERSIAYMQAMHSALGLNTLCDERRALLDWCAAAASAADAVSVHANVIQAVIAKEDKDTEMGLLSQQLLGAAEAIQLQLKAVRRRVPQDENVTLLALEPDTYNRLHGQCLREIGLAARATALASRAASSAAALGGDAADGAPLPHDALQAIVLAATDRIYHQEERGAGELLRASLTALAGEAARVAAYVQEHEYDMLNMANNQPEKPTSPLVLRAQLVKKQLEETKTLTLKLENKEADIRELKKALKGKQDEMSEMQIRKELAEKKLSSASRDAELKEQKLARKLEDTFNQLKRKEKEFEETMDHLQQDIDSLESERGALRDKLKLYAKRGGQPIPPEELSTSLICSPSSAMSKVTPISTDQLTDALQKQVKVLTWAVRSSLESQAVGDRVRERRALRALRPLHDARAAHARRQQAQALEQKLAQLQFDWTMFVAKSGIYKFPEEPSQYAEALEKHKMKQRQQKADLTRRLVEIQADIKEQLLAHRPWRCVDADFAKFPTPDLTKAVNTSQDGVDVGTISFPHQAGMEHDATVYVTPSQLQRLREMVEELGSEDVKIDFDPGFEARTVGAA